MFRFAHPEFLYLLLLVPLLIVGYVLAHYRQQRRLRRIGDVALLRQLMVDVSHTRPHVKFALLLVALALIIFILARPQYGTKQETVKHSGIEAIIAVDVSNSMLCQDVAPSRLEKSKMIVSKLIEQLDEDKVGLVAFAGSAITLLPITGDNVSAKMFLNQLSPSTIALQGTNVAEAINRAVAGFSDKKGVGQALILITDAENHEPGALEAVRAAKEKGIRCFVLAVGTTSGGPIPMGNGTYKKDNSGQVVTTQLNPEVGKQIAQAGDGIYIQVDQTNRAQQLLAKEIDTMQKADFKSTLYAEYDEQFIAVAILLLLVIIAEACIMEKRNPLLRRFVSDLFGSSRATMLALLLLTAAAAQAQSSDRDFIRMGNRYFHRGQYHDAEICYQKAIDKRPSMEAYYNLANALTQQGLDSTANERYKEALKMPSSNKLKRANIYHNIGVIHYATGLREKKIGGQYARQAFYGAVENFKSALRLDPTNDQTRYDLAMAQWQLKNLQNDGGGGGGNDDQNDQDQNQDQQGQNQDQQNQNQDQQDQDQDQQDQDQNQQNQQQPQQQDQNQIDERTAEQLLNSAQQDEKEVQRKVQAVPTSRRSLEKDW